MEPSALSPFLSRFLLALFAARAVNLAQIAVLFGGAPKVESNDKRIQRFLKAFKISEAEIARLVVSWLKLQPPFVLTIDRTKWQFGKRRVNILMLAIASDGVVIPLCVVVVSSVNSAAQLLSNYCLRRRIETLFGCLKTRGFQLEETHLTETERVSRSLTLLTLAFCWARFRGKLVCQQQPLEKKKHGRLEKSVFRAV